MIIILFFGFHWNVFISYLDTAQTSRARAFQIDGARCGGHFLQETPLISHYSLSFIAGDSDGRLSDAVHGTRRQGVLQAGDRRRAGRVDGREVQGEGRRAQRGGRVSGKKIQYKDEKLRVGCMNLRRPETESGITQPESHHFIVDIGCRTTVSQ